MQGRKKFQKKSNRRSRAPRRIASAVTLGELPGKPKARYFSIGPSMPVPRFTFQEKMHSFRFQAVASAFKTKTNLTASQIKGAAAAYGIAFGWSLVDLPEATNLIGLFDQFRIRKVVLRICASHNTNATGLGSLLYVVEDYDNSNLLTSVANAQSYESCQVLRGSDTGNGDGCTLSLTPCIPVSTNLGNMIKPCPWQDCAVTDNTHYGVKGWYQTAAATDPVWDVDAQYWVDFINTQ